MQTDLPENIYTRLVSAIHQTQMLSNARLTDAKFGGNGRYEAETYLSKKEGIDRAHATIAKIEDTARENGIDLIAVYDAHGYPIDLSTAALAWLKSRA